MNEKEEISKLKVMSAQCSHFVKCLRDRPSSIAVQRAINNLENAVSWITIEVDRVKEKEAEKEAIPSIAADKKRALRRFGEIREIVDGPRYSELSSSEQILLFKEKDVLTEYLMVLNSRIKSLTKD